MATIGERRKQLLDTVEVVTGLVRCIRQRRVLQSANPKPHLTFWLIINNALFDAAVLDWCKLFGSDDEERQPTHWKKVILEPRSRCISQGPVFDRRRVGEGMAQLLARDEALS